MKDEFFVVLTSSSCASLFPQNKATRFTTQLPQNFYLPGDWSVALVEVQIPHTFQHISVKNDEGQITVKKCRPGDFMENSLRPEIEKDVDSSAYVSPGIYPDLESILREINSLSCVKDHLCFQLRCGGFVEVSRTCQAETCVDYTHYLVLSEKLRKIMGFNGKAGEIHFIDKNSSSIVADTPANLINALPNAIMIYSDICEPYVTGDVQSRLLRMVPLDLHSYKYGGVEIKNFPVPMYIPLLSTAFQSIEIDIRDEHGNAVPFDYGTLTATLHFKRTS